jgi:hypothetical protein
MNNVNYDVAYKYMVCVPKVEQKKRDDILVKESGIVLSVEKVHGNSVRRISDCKKGQHVDYFC